MNRRDQFGVVPYRAIDGGLAAKMTGADAKVYLAIAAHSGAGWTAKPSYERLARLSGLRKRSVIRAIQRLEQIGALSVVHHGGRGHANEYQLCTVNSDPPVTVSEAKTVTLGDQNGDTARSETVTGRALNGDRTVTPTDKEQIKEHIRTEAGRAGVRETLVKDGLSAAKADELVTLVPGLTAGMIGRLAMKAATGQNPAGLLVHLIRTEGPALVEAERQQIERLRRDSDAQAERRRAEADARQRLERERREREAVIAALALDELEALRQRALETAVLPAERRRWKTADPMKDWTLAAAICRLIKNDRAKVVD